MLACGFAATAAMAEAPRFPAMAEAPRFPAVAEAPRFPAAPTAVALAGPLPSGGFFGRVRDAGTGRPLPGAHVFIAGSLMGTAADADGRFLLDGVPAGSHRVVASMLGFETASVDTTLAEGLIEINLSLTPRVIQAGAIEVVARQDEKWNRNLGRFKREFLGQSEAAAAGELVNPEVLDFESTWWGRLRARASAPLSIENRHLGYSVTYHLQDYDYTPSVLRYDDDPVFEELTAASAAEAAAWEENRRTAFRGSFRHFLLALLADSTESEGFRLFRRPSLESPVGSPYRFGVTPSRLLRDPDSVGVTLHFTGFIEIIYEPEEEESAFLKSQGLLRPPAPQQSWIKLTNGPTRVDWLGSAIDPYGITVYGYLAFERVGDELPKEYRPPGVHLSPR